MANGAGIPRIRRILAIIIAKHLIHIRAVRVMTGNAGKFPIGVKTILILENRMAENGVTALQGVRTRMAVHKNFCVVMALKAEIGDLSQELMRK